MHRKVILILGLAAAAALVAVALQGFAIHPVREEQRRYLMILLAAVLSLLLGQGWVLLFFSALGRQLRGLVSEQTAAVVERLLALGRRCRPWAAAAVVLAVAFFFLNPAFGHRWAPEWLAPGLLLLTFGVHCWAVWVANGALQEQEKLLLQLDRDLTSAN
jgi:hypothetical protein